MEDMEMMRVELQNAVLHYELQTVVRYNFRHKFPDPTHFRKASSTEVTWARNRPYNVTNGSLYATPTNFRCLSHLNLEEFTFDAGASGFYVYPEHVRKTCRLKRVRDIFSLEYCQGDLDIREEIAAMLELEYAIRALSVTRAACHAYLQSEIRRAVDPSSIRRRVRYSKDVITVIIWFFHEQWNAALRCLQSSEAIMHCFAILLFRHEDVARNSFACSDVLIEKYLIESPRVGIDGRAVLCDLYRRKEFFRVASPFQLTFSGTGSEEFGYYFAYLAERKIPLMLSWMTPEFPSDDDTLWPYLGVYGTPQGYFYSSECRKRLVFDLLRGLLRSSVGKDVSDNIRTVWRAVPTPLPTLEFVEDILQIIKGFGDPSFSSLEHFMKEYPTECIAETNQPRSLLHLARCAFRHTFNDDLSTPYISLPKCLRNYVHLKC